jgi:hypothetical protein
MNSLIRLFIHKHCWEARQTNVSGGFRKENQPKGEYAFLGIGTLIACSCGLQAIKFEGMRRLGILE